MGFLATRTATVELGGDYYAVVRELTSGEYGDVERPLTEAKVVGDAKSARMDMAPNLTEFRRRLVTASLVGWNLTDENDVMLPLPEIPEGVTGQDRAVIVKQRRASVDRLPQWAFEMIRAAADKLNGPRDSAEIASFPGEDVGSGANGSGGAAGAGPVHPGVGTVAEAGPSLGGTAADPFAS